jgi:hypothetical protein
VSNVKSFVRLWVQEKHWNVSAESNEITFYIFKNILNHQLTSLTVKIESDSLFHCYEITFYEDFKMLTYIHACILCTYTHTHTHIKFPVLVLPSGQELTLGILVTIALGVVPFCAYALFPVLLPFLNVSWKSCTVRDSAPAVILPQSPFVSTWRLFSLISNWRNREVTRGDVRQVGWVWDDNHVIFLLNNL